MTCLIAACSYDEGEDNFFDCGLSAKARMRIIWLVPASLLRQERGNLDWWRHLHYSEDEDNLIGGGLSTIARTRTTWLVSASSLRRRRGQELLGCLRPFR